MKKDNRRGAEHWTGCHSFENIICDGKVQQQSGPRRGGLKMGGTYWYYYQLDNDIDHHNPFEPSTTSCPMLPGQPVNMLKVPVYLSSDSRRQKNASISSTDSESRTMDPEDKYVNPRPVPRPSMAPENLSTPSKSTPDHAILPLGKSSTPQPSHKRNATLPSRALSLRSFHLPGIPSRITRGRSASPTSRQTGLKPTIREIAPLKLVRSRADIGRGRNAVSAPHEEQPSSRQDQRADPSRVQRSCARTPDASPQRSSRDKHTTPFIDPITLRPQANTLLLRQGPEQMQNVEEAFSIPSFLDHRRQRSRSREPSPLQKSSITVDHSKAGSQPLYQQPLETLPEVNSAHKAPTSRPPVADFKASERPHTNRLLEATAAEACNKCLPALPNAPSSAVLRSEPATMPSSTSSPPLKGLGSGTSQTIMSGEYHSSTAQSHLSHWTSTTLSSFSSSQWSSVLLDGKSPAFSQKTTTTSQPTSPYEVIAYPPTPDFPQRRNSSPTLDSHRLPSIMSSSTASSYGNTQPASPINEASNSMRDCSNEHSLLSKRYGMMLGNLQGYKLPTDLQASKPFFNPQLPSKHGRSHDVFLHRLSGDSVQQTSHDEFQHSKNMHQMLHELKYLGDFIQE